MRFSWLALGCLVALLTATDSRPLTPSTLGLSLQVRTPVARLVRAAVEPPETIDEFGQVATNVDTAGGGTDGWASTELFGAPPVVADGFFGDVPDEQGTMTRLK